jgi:hypothetical protein
MHFRSNFVSGQVFQLHTVVDTICTFHLELTLRTDSENAFTSILQKMVESKN